MKADKINIITIASSSNYKPSKEFEELRNKQLIELYKQFQERPFEYATIDYFENKEPRIKTYTSQSEKMTNVSKFQNSMKKFITKISKLFRK